MEALITALVAMMACVVVLTKPWGYVEKKKNPGS